MLLNELQNTHKLNQVMQRLTSVNVTLMAWLLMGL